MCPFHVTCQLYRHRIFRDIPLSFGASGHCGDVPLAPDVFTLSSLFVTLLSGRSGWKVHQFPNESLQGTSFGSTDFLCCLSVFYFVAFVRVVISFLLLVSHVICSFQFPKEETGVLD